MEKNKVVIVSIVSALVLAVFATGYFLITNRCTLDGDSVCFDKQAEVFKVEEDAKLLVQVENENLGNYLVETWDALHPDNKGAIETVIHAPLTVKELSQGLPYDVMLTNQSNASYFLNDLQNLGNDLGGLLGSRIPSQLQDAINLKGYYFVPNSIDGWYFVYNETLLGEMGFSMESDNEYGLPTAFDSWEKILAASDTILEKAKYVFPLTFVDQTSFYPFLTGGRWTLNFTHNGSKPGFESREFREGLRLIELLGTSELYKDGVLIEEETPNTEDNDNDLAEEPVENQVEANTEKELLPWLYEEAFYNRETPFTILHSSMQFDAYKEKTTDVYKVAPFPRYNDHHLSPMGEVNGYMVNGSVLYPSASAEVLRILRSPEALKVYESADGKTPIYSRTYFDELDFEDEIMDQILSYNYHDTPSVLALSNNPSKLARSLYDDVKLMDIFEEVYLKKSTVEQAQEKVVKRVNEWLEEYDVSENEGNE